MILDYRWFSLHYDLFNPDRTLMLCCQGDACIVESESGGDYFILNIDDSEEETRFALTPEELDFVLGS